MLKFFAEKNVSSFCSAKATHIFSAKNFRILCIESAKTVKEMTLNELVKLTTGPWLGTNIFQLQLELYSSALGGIGQVPFFVYFCLLIDSTFMKV